MTPSQSGAAAHSSDKPVAGWEPPGDPRHQQPQAEWETMSPRAARGHQSKPISATAQIRVPISTAAKTTIAERRPRTSKMPVRRIPPARDHIVERSSQRQQPEPFRGQTEADQGVDEARQNKDERDAGKARF